ncbi:MAG: hypothetical protein ACRDTC_17825 [Pseudonocardiaceae bacterium]
MVGRTGGKSWFGNRWRVAWPVSAGEAKVSRLNSCHDEEADVTKAETTTGREINFLTLTGKDDTQIVYSTSSITGEPQLTYRDRMHDLSFRGDDISTTASPLGTLVTVVLESIPDSHTFTASLVLPDINLGDRQVIRFKTMVVLTTNLTSIGGPTLVIGPLQTYQVVKLTGVAQHVEF